MINQLIDSNVPFSGPDVQEGSFSIDGVARFTCNTYEEIKVAAEQGGGFDVVVIGSGMYGAYLAAKIFERGRRLSGAAPRVLILESGPFLISEHFQNLTRMGKFFELVNRPLVDDGQAFVTQINTGGALEGFTPHHRCVGGKSLFWGGWAPPLGAEDAKDDLFQWPGEVRDFLLSPEGYERTARQIGTHETADYLKSNFLTELKTRADAILTGNKVPSLTAVRHAPIAVQGSSPISGLFSMDKFSSLPLLLDSIREDAEERSNPDRRLFLVPKAEVLKIETAEGKARELLIRLKEPVRLSQEPGKTSQLLEAPGQVDRLVRLPLKEGAAVVLAGNTVQSTRLALNSCRKPAELGTELAGRNLMAHVRGNYFWRIRRSAMGLPASLTSFETSALHIEGRVELPGGRRGRFHFQFYALGSMGDNPEEYLYRFFPNLEDLEDVEQATTSTDLDQWIVVGIRTCGEMIGDRTQDAGSGSVSGITVNPFGGAGDDVFFENGVEQRVPKVHVRLLQSADDALIRKAQTDAAFAFITALATPADGSPIDASKLQFIKGGEDGMGSTYHESGTLWMGEDPASSVTDVHGRLHHLSNVYGTDQAVFPTVGSANPVPTGLALTERLANHLLSRLRPLPALVPEPGFTSLFDGSLQGWQKFGGGKIQPLPGLNIIEAGERGADSALGFIRSTAQFQDFELMLEWKSFSGRANSGIFLRMPELQNNDFDALYAASIEIQIDETGKWFDRSRNPQSVFGSSLHKTGAVYGLAPATRWAAKPPSPQDGEGLWNRYRIRLQDSLIDVELNGEMVVKQFTLPPNLLGAGHIALQCHTEIVQFRNILIKPL